MTPDVRQDEGATESLTVCTVSYFSRPLLERNIALSRTLNPGRRLRWIVVENTPDPDRRMAAVDADTTILEGVAPVRDHLRAGSMHHALGLHLALRRVTTRFVLMLDPDFFIVRPAWAGDVVGHMEREGLALFGVPWHPKWQWKYRYFPCAHCLFIDSAKIDLAALDFRPGDDDASPPRPAPNRARRTLAGLAPEVVRRAAANLAERRGIGITRDTSHRLYRTFGHRSDIGVECALPVYRLDIDYPVTQLRAFSRAMDHLLPDRYSYAPKRAGSYVGGGFAEAGVVGALAPGWEEFFWRGAPFGFHVRGQQRTGETGNDFERISAILRGLPARG